MDFKFISIDEEGFFHFSGVRVADRQIGSYLLRNLKLASNNSLETQLEGVSFKVEAFDHPWVIQSVESFNSSHDMLKAQLPYEVEVILFIKDLYIDEWDRFVGVDRKTSIPFVFSRKAQAQFFELCDQFDDYSITYKNVKYSMLSPYNVEISVDKVDFWEGKYQSFQQPGWELETHHPSLPFILPHLKLNKSRILILGCGSGNDAAYFANLGHLVTAVDFSKTAIERARKKYGHLKQIDWIEGDIFDSRLLLNQRSFDLIFEHTCFCAIPPSKRRDLVALWSQKLHEDGYLLGIFFSMWHIDAPPFGSTEWEIKKRLGSFFTPLYWQRLRPPLALEVRLGTEFLVYAKKIKTN